jgi:hypothetical protein
LTRLLRLKKLLLKSKDNPFPPHTFKPSVSAEGFFVYP